MLNRLMHIAQRVAVGLVLSCAVASAAHGQVMRVVRGTVLDGSDRPIGSAAVLARGGASAISDDSGRFQLEIAHRNDIILDVRRFGFMPSRVGLGGGGDTTLSILLLPLTQRLPTVEVMSAGALPPALAGFAERMRDRKKGAGVGTFITDREIERMNATRVTQTMESVPSIFVRRASGDRYAVYAKATGGGGECAAAVFLDGIRIKAATEYIVDRRGRMTGAQRDGAVTIDDYVQPMEVAGVEVYQRAMLAPSMLQPVGDDRAMKCAVIAVWTKHR